jgi:hypothetical protein
MSYVLRTASAEHQLPPMPRHGRISPGARRAWYPAGVFLVSLLIDLGADIATTAIAAEPSGTLRPGETYTVEFPKLAPDRRGQVAKMQFRIPETYNARQLFPLFVWLAGGDGSHTIGAGYQIADPRRFVLVGLPYPQGADDKYQDTMVGDFPRIWKYHRAMLQELTRRVPNISPAHWAVGGFSNGGHCIDGFLKIHQPASTFAAFILVEGGGYRGGHYSSAVQGKPVLVAWGALSSHRPVAKNLAHRLKFAGMIVDTMEMQGVGHAFPANYQQLASQWFLR